MSKGVKKMENKVDELEELEESFGMEIPKLHKLLNKRDLLKAEIAILVEECETILDKRYFEYKKQINLLRQKYKQSGEYDYDDDEDN
jgi:hypothetical protein